MAWIKRFYDPIILPDGRKLLTLRDAAEYITALPKAEHDAADWQVAMETLLLFAERGASILLLASPGNAVAGRRARRAGNAGVGRGAAGVEQKRTAVSGRWRAHK
jgi:hypothetical protein